MDIFSATVMLFFIMDPLGNIPPFIFLLKDLEPQRRKKVLVRELLISYLALLVFLFLGRFMLVFLNLKQESISVAGGIVLFLIALHMIFPSDKHAATEPLKEEPFIVPLAIPMFAGPSTMAAVMLLAQSYPDRMEDWFSAITFAWAISAPILFFAPLLYRFLGQKGLIAMERLMGMILVMISVQLFLEGVSGYIKL